MRIGRADLTRIRGNIRFENKIRENIRVIYEASKEEKNR